MTMARSWMGGVLGLLVALSAAGCQDPNNLMMERLQARNQELERENDDLRSRLAAMTRDRDQWQARARALEQQVRQLQDQLQEQPVEVLPGWQQSGVYSWATIETDLLFDSGRATLRPGARARLQEIVGQIQQNYPDRDIWVLGHTDTDPIRRTKDLWQDNLDLSCNRAMTVYRELASMGITPSNMLAGGQGEHFPVASNSTRDGKQQNRRVEIIAVPSRPPTGTSITEPARGATMGENQPGPARRTIPSDALTPVASD